MGWGGGGGPEAERTRMASVDRQTDRQTHTHTQSQCSDRYNYNLFPPFPSQISLMVSVDVKHHLYLLTDIVPLALVSKASQIAPTPIVLKHIAPTPIVLK